VKAGWSAADIPELTGRTAIVTGASGGPRRETAEGFETHFGVNHLGHFALTGLLLPQLGNRSCVVTMSTGLAAQARIDFADLQSERRYRMTAAYGQSKLAQLMFASEFDRRLRSGGTGVASFAPAALDQVAAGRLWDISSELTGVSYDRLPWPA
jgi:NAD(P)-dependent dehydrogenase (short-subunit alcohol dehydrogenase family)